MPFGLRIIALGDGDLLVMALLDSPEALLVLADGSVFRGLVVWGYGYRHGER
jgi:hypothetical protein